MPTKAQIQEQLNTALEQRDAALRNSIGDASLRDLSSALLNRLDTLVDEKRDERDTCERQLDALSDAYGEADSVDDTIIALDD